MTKEQRSEIEMKVTMLEEALSQKEKAERYYRDARIRLDDALKIAGILPPTPGKDGEQTVTPVNLNGQEK